MPFWQRLLAPRLTLPSTEPVLTATALLWLTVTLTLAAAPYANQLPLWLVPVFALIAAWRAAIVIYQWLPPPRWMLPVLALLATAGVLITYRTLLGRDAGVALLTVMTACKLLETRTVRDGVVLVFLGYLLVMSNLLYSQEIPRVVFLAGVITLMLVAQILIHPQHAGLNALAPLRLVGKMVLAAIPVMLLLFILFPRIPGPLWGLPKDAYQGRTGLAGEMEPGTISELVQSGDVAFRVRFTGAMPPPAQRYWRGPVLEDFDGRRWRPHEAAPMATLAPFTPAGDPIDYAVIMEPSNRRWLLALDLPASLPPRASMTSAFQLLRDQPVNEVYRYEVRSYPRYRTGALTEALRLASLHLPAGSNPRARQLAEDWRLRHPQPEARVKAALALFREQPFSYTLRPPRLGVHSIDEFLFGTRQGFCEHYASAFVFLMRATAIPARIVTGYQGGEPNNIDNYLIVRQSDAHAWAEVWLDERGWVRVDPTAAVSPDRVEQGLYGALAEADELPFLARRGGHLQWLRQLAMGWDTLNIRWNEWVLAYGPDRQKRFLSGLGFGTVDWKEMVLALVGAMSGLMLLVLLLRWYRLRPADPVVRAWQRFCTRLARRGWQRRPHEGPLDFSQRVATHRPEWAGPVREIGELYARLRYGPESSGAAVQRLQRLTRRFHP